MKKIIIVDDRESSEFSDVQVMKASFAEITNNTYFGDSIEGVKLAAALPQVKYRVQELQSQGDEVVGLAIDLFQQLNDPIAGERLLDAIQSDINLKSIPVVIYTFTYTNVIADRLISKGVKGVVKRRLTGGDSTKEMAKRVLEAFGFI